jgi:hypothetical protein
MEVRWTVHIPQAMQQHGGGPRARREEATTPAPDTRADDKAPQHQTEKAK